MAREMKDSGVEWIGLIPTDWKVQKLKYSADFPLEKYSEDRANLPYLGLENIVSWNGKYVNSDSQYDKSQSLVYEADDILWGKLRPYLAKVYQAPTTGCCSTEFCVIRPFKEYDVRFFWNMLISSEFVSMIDRSTYGSKMPRANVDYIKNSLIPIPPLPEQTLIASYLDAQCSRIDAIIEQTRVSIEELKKLKQATITRAVTKGIRPGREMKDSGIEWIGEIPKEWEVRRIKTIFTLRDERNNLPLEEVNLISLYTDMGVVQHCDLEKNTGNKAQSAEGYKKVYENDIIVNIILCWMGAIGRSAYAGVTSPAYDVYIPSDQIECRFYHHYFRTVGFGGDCFKRGKGIMAMRWRTYSDQFRDIRVLVPSLKEQREIIEYLDCKITEIDRMIAKKDRFLSDLEDYKKSLIYEYVTGKKEVNS